MGLLQWFVCLSDRHHHSTAYRLGTWRLDGVGLLQCLHNVRTVCSGMVVVGEVSRGSDMMVMGTWRLNGVGLPPPPLLLLLLPPCRHG
jgi:hypothetical protein